MTEVYAEAAWIHPTSKLFRNIDSFTRQLSFHVTKPTSSHYICPFSIHSMLSILADCSQESTEQELRRVIFPFFQVDSVHYWEVSRRLLDATSGLKLYRKLYIHTRYFLEERFDARTDYYRMDRLGQVNFGNNVEAAENINSWLDDVSEHKIQDIVTAPDFDIETRMILLSATYFTASFLHPFTTGATFRGEYLLHKGERVDCEFMCMEGVLLYAKHRELRSDILHLKFSNQEFSMLLIVPEMGAPLDRTERNLRHIPFSELISSTTERHVSLKLPKFKIEYRIDLTDVLKEFGLRACYARYARFSWITEEPRRGDAIRISKVIQKCSIGINEFGGDTAEAGGHEPVPANPPPSPPSTGSGSPVDLIVNRPFLFAIFVCKEGFYCPLTIGKVYKP